MNYKITNHNLSLRKEDLFKCFYCDDMHNSAFVATCTNK